MCLLDSYNSIFDEQVLALVIQRAFDIFQQIDHLDTLSVATTPVGHWQHTLITEVAT